MLISVPLLSLVRLLLNLEAMKQHSPLDAFERIFGLGGGLSTDSEWRTSRCNIRF